MSCAHITRIYDAFAPDMEEQGEYSEECHMTSPTDPAIILRFISLFASAREPFLNGLCYWFSYILQSRFGGETLYDQIDGHFLQRIAGRLYDVTGDVTEKYSSVSLLPWAELEDIDCNLYRILLRDCVRKDRRNDDTSE